MHCPQGHLYDETNTYWQVRQNGHKTPNCRTCSRERMATKRKLNPLYARDLMREWRAANPERDRKNYTENRRQKKEWLDSQKVSCKICGESRVACLDFHHRDPSQKEANLSEAVASWSIKRLQREVAKCDVICSNCHRCLDHKELE